MSQTKAAQPAAAPATRPAGATMPAHAARARLIELLVRQLLASPHRTP